MLLSRAPCCCELPLTLLSFPFSLLDLNGGTTKKPNNNVLFEQSF